MPLPPLSPKAPPAHACPASGALMGHIQKGSREGGVMHIYLQQRDPATVPTRERASQRERLQSMGGLLPASPKHRLSPLSLATSSSFPT